MNNILTQSWLLSRRDFFRRSALCLGMAVLASWSNLDASGEKPMTAASDMFTNLPVPKLGVRQEDLAPIYGGLWTFVWVKVPEIPGCVLDLLCYEHSNIELLDYSSVGGVIQLRHRSIKDPNLLLITTVTPRPGKVEIVARMEVDREKTPEGKLPDILLKPNLCFRLKRADGSFSSFPDPFPEFISRCFIFTDKGQTFLTDMERKKVQGVAENDARNNPPWVQVYHHFSQPVPKDAPPASFYQNGPTPYTVPVIGVVSRDRKYLTAIADDSSTKVAQAWQQCLHTYPEWMPKDAPPAERRWRMNVYVMPNQPEALLKRVAEDFPNASKLGEK